MTIPRLASALAPHPATLTSRGDGIAASFVPSRNQLRHFLKMSMGNDTATYSRPLSVSSLIAQRAHAFSYVGSHYHCEEWNDEASPLFGLGRSLRFARNDILGSGTFPRV